MHEFIREISEVIDEKFKISKSSDSICIQEKKNSKACKKLTINLGGKKVFAFNLDQKRTKTFRTFQFFNPRTSGITKINDGILVIVEDGKIIFLLFELKSDNFSIGDVEKKIKNAEYFCLYIINILNEHYKKTYKDIVFKSILVTTNTRKTTTVGNKRVSFKKQNNIALFASIPCNRDYKIETFL